MVSNPALVLLLAHEEVRENIRPEHPLEAHQSPQSSSTYAARLRC